MMRTLSLLYRKLIIETHSEFAVICVSLYTMYWGFRALFGVRALALLTPTLLIGALIFYRLRSRTTKATTTDSK